MEKSIGFHFYIDVPNINEIIRGEEKANEEVKRAIHRLHTYFSGIESIVKHFEGVSEKYSRGRVHIYIDQKEGEANGDYAERSLRLMIATFRFVYDVFNNLGKYSQYPGFSACGGAGYGEYYKYDIEGMDEFTTIGGPANIAAKLTVAAPKKYFYITDSVYKLLPPELREYFELLDEDRLGELRQQLKGNPLVYEALYSKVYTNDQTIDDLLKDVEKECTEIANNLNLNEMVFEDARTKIDFSRLSRKKSKQITAGVMYADLRGFTKLFNVSGSNLDNLSRVLKDVFEEMNNAVNENDGVRVQFQGDRIVAVFNDYSSQPELEVVRMFKAALLIKDRISELNELYKEELMGRKLKVGIGICYGEFYATRLGRRGHADNQVLGSTTDQGEIAEDRYADEDEVVVSKQFKAKVQSLAEESIACSVILDNLISIDKTGYYKTTMTLEEFNNAVEAVTQDATQNAFTEIVRPAFSAPIIHTPQGPERRVRPWRP